MSRIALMLCALGALGLGGCQTTKPPNEMSYVELKQYAASLVERCKQEGAKPGAETQACVNQEARADEAKRTKSDQQRRAFGLALANASRAYGNSLQANRPVTCNTSRYGNYATTRCY